MSTKLKREYLRGWNWHRWGLRPEPHYLSVRVPTVNLVGLFVCYLIGAYGYSVLLLVPLFVVLFVYWSEKHEALQRTVREHCERRRRVEQAALGPEGTGWLNTIIGVWWGCCAGTVSDFAKDWIAPVIDQFKFPARVEIVDMLAFDTGVYRPIVSNPRLVDQSETMETGKERTMTIEMDVDVNVPKSHLLLRGRLGGRKFLINVEGFHLKGRLRAMLAMNTSFLFPHFSTIKVGFASKPHLTVNCCILRDTIQVFEVPWLKNIVMEDLIASLHKYLIYPKGIEFDFSHVQPYPTEWNSLKQSGLSEGVLAVTVSGVSNKEHIGNPVHYCSLRLGSQKCVRWFGNSKEYWSSTFSFLVHNYHTQELLMKVKRKHTLRKVVVANQRLSLHSLELQPAEPGKPVIREVTVGVSRPGACDAVKLVLSYTALPTFSTLQAPPTAPPTNILQQQQFAGVLYIQVHGARCLGDRGALSQRLLKTSELSCSVHSNMRSRVLATHSVTGTVSPVWGTNTELLVPDLAQVQLSFEVCCTRMGVADRIGSAHFSPGTDHAHLLQQRLPLVAAGAGSSAIGSLYVSVVFRPVESVSQTVSSLILSYTSRTRRRSLAACLDVTTDLLNPSTSRFGKSVGTIHEELEESGSSSSDDCASDGSG